MDNVVGFDFETHLIEPGLLAPPPVCVTWFWGQKQAEIQHCGFEPDGVLSMFEHLLTGKENLVGAKTAYDVAVCMERWPQTIPWWFEAYANDRIFDVQINQQLIDIANGCLSGYVTHEGKKVVYKYSLAALQKRLLGVDRFSQKKGDDVWRLRYAELEDVPLEAWPEEAVTYALDDAVGAYRVLEHQMSSAHLLKNAAAQARADLALHLMSCWGVHTHRKGIEYLREFVTGEYERLTEYLQKVGLVRKTGSRNTKKAKAWMWDVMTKIHGKKPKLTKTGFKLRIQREASLTEEEHRKYTALDADSCEQSGDETLIAYARRTTLASIVKNKIPKLELGINRPIQPAFNVLVESGRTSCREARDGAPTNGYQLQNPSRTMPVRQCFIARPVKLHIDNDLKSLEMCTFAQVCMALVGFSRLGELLNAGMDPHLDFGAKMLGITYEDALANRRDPEVKNARQAAKPANFGLPGGMGARGFVAFARLYGLIISETRAGEMREQWMDNYPETNPFFRLIGDMCRELGVCTVHQLFVGRERGLTPYTAACNSYFQGLGADVAKEGLWAVCRASYDPTRESVLYGTRPWTFVHDQILAECDGYESIKTASKEQIVKASQCATEAARLMIEHGNKYLPDVPVGCDPSLSKVWHKGTEPVYNVDGYLVAWDIARDERIEVYDTQGEMILWD